MGGVKPNKHGTARTAATADNSKRQPAGDRGRSPAHQRRVPHVLQSNGICHWTCARADEPDPAEGSAVTEPVPKPHTAAKPRGPQQTTARRGTGGKTCRSPDPQRHSPHATRHCGETWCTPSATGSREGPMAGRALWEYTYRPCPQRRCRGGLYQGLSTSLTKMGHLPGRGCTLRPRNGRCCPCLRGQSP